MTLHALLRADVLLRNYSTTRAFIFSRVTLPLC